MAAVRTYLARKNPPEPEKKIISEVKISISEIENLDFERKKEAKTPCVQALSSSLVQIYNIRPKPCKASPSQD